MCLIADKQFCSQITEKSSYSVLGVSVEPHETCPAVSFLFYSLAFCLIWGLWLQYSQQVFSVFIVVVSYLNWFRSCKDYGKI